MESIGLVVPDFGYGSGKHIQACAEWLRSRLEDGDMLAKDAVAELSSVWGESLWAQDPSDGTIRITERWLIDAVCKAAGIRKYVPAGRKKTRWTWTLSDAGIPVSEGSAGHGHDPNGWMA